MGRSAEDWRAHRENLIAARLGVREAMDRCELSTDDTRFTETVNAVHRAEVWLERAEAALNEAIGRVTGGWWDCADE